MGDIDAARRAVHALRLLVILAVLLAVTAGLRPAEARDCRDETPLPGDVKLIAPGPDIAPEAARFAGAWTGAWKERIPTPSAPRWSSRSSCPAATPG